MTTTLRGWAAIMKTRRCAARGEARGAHTVEVALLQSDMRAADGLSLSLCVCVCVCVCVCACVQVREAASERALAFFVEQAKKLDNSGGGGATLSAGGGIAAASSSMLFPATVLARRLQTKTKAAARARQLRRDALVSLQGGTHSNSLLRLFVGVVL